MVLKDKPMFSREGQTKEDWDDEFHRQRLVFVEAALNHPATQGRIDPAFAYVVRHPKVRPVGVFLG